MRFSTPMRSSYLMPRVALFTAVFGSAIVFGSCTSPTTFTGTPCQSDSDCNIDGQRCVAGLRGGPTICTHPCGADSECQVGFDCTVSDQNLGRTCNVPLYGVDSTSGAPLLFGKSCSLSDNACKNTGDPNAMPVCRKAPDTSKDPPYPPVASDPGAYCTGA